MTGELGSCGKFDYVQLPYSIEQLVFDWVQSDMPGIYLDGGNDP